MNIIRKVSSPQGNQSMYSSQRQLFDDDNTSDDIVVGTIHNLKPKSFVNNAFEIDELKVPVQAVVEKQELEIIDDDENTSCDIQKISSSSDIQEMIRDASKNGLSEAHRRKTRKQKHSLDVESNASSLSISNSKLNIDSDRKFSIRQALKPSNVSDDELLVGKVADSNIENTDESSELSVKRKAKSKKKSKRKELDLSQTEDHEMTDVKHNKKKENHTIGNQDPKIIGVHILSSQVLQKHLFLNKPSVRVYVVDYQAETVICTENSITKSAVQTKPFDFREKCTILPKWNEILLLDSTIIEDMKSLKNIIILFDIVDEVQMSDETSGTKSFESVSWAFIKPLGHDDCSNMNKKLKLQLYEVDQSHTNKNKTNVYEWWKSKPWKKYPSVLNVIVMSLKCKDYSDKMNSIKLAIMSNNRDEAIIRSKKYLTNCKKVYNFDSLSMQKRASGECVEIPNTIISTLNTADGNTTIVKFSTCGKYLAYSALESDKYVINVYKIPEFEEIIKLSCHKGLIYDICWNMSSTQLITASADNLAYIWNISDREKCTKQKLHHSTFVYAAKFCKANENIIATGCYDKIIRIWILEFNVDPKYRLSDELVGHNGYVNTICFLDYSEMFYSGDSDGAIFKWAKGKDGWVKLLDINVEEFKGKIINDLVLFNDNQRVLVVMRNDFSWSMNVNSSTTFTCYKNGILNRYQARGCLSPCGTFVLIGSNIWNASTGELCTMLSPVQFDHHPIMSLDFHPFYNLTALSCGRRNSPLVLCYHVHKPDIDPNLGMEIYVSNMINCNRVDASDSKFSLKGAVEKMNGENLKFNSKTPKRNIKLWDLLRKMDDLLNRAKQNGADTHKITMNTSEDRVRIEKIGNYCNEKSPKSESSNVLSVNLTDFYEKMNKLNVQNCELDSSSLTESHDTYTLENEKPINAKKDKKKKKYIENEPEGSSTLSNAESIDDDQNTYTISKRAIT